ncbi:hypothetical protein PPERSA_10403 [Pseudocohnilembus persalinus]|uniref:Vacuolar protein-sorting-associated protein 36 n=1 Tax=Pseudocohnilembus persalinus TaxID=266149 RepID=A0A0V0QWI7_PSEPJ|nr:hypothetical protein PPERSA_10403 [Pseudocohnilembus persalinus]|eukprot:KRX06545.1 hypothetical protein PPERSA_10403 [Pseudocohnilembus persalinus]
MEILQMSQICTDKQFTPKTDLEQKKLNLLLKPSNISTTEQNTNYTQIFQLIKMPMKFSKTTIQFSMHPITPKLDTQLMTPQSRIKKYQYQDQPSAGKDSLLCTDIKMGLVTDVFSLKLLQGLKHVEKQVQLECYPELQEFQKLQKRQKQLLVYQEFFHKDFFFLMEKIRLLKTLNQDQNKQNVKSAEKTQPQQTSKTTTTTNSSTKTVSLLKNQQAPKPTPQQPGPNSQKTSKKTKKISPKKTNLSTSDSRPKPDWSTQKISKIFPLIKQSLQKPKNNLKPNSTPPKKYTYTVEKEQTPKLSPKNQRIPDLTSLIYKAALKSMRNTKMTDLGEFYIRRDILENSLKQHNEQELGPVHKKVDFDDASNQKKQIKIKGLNCQVTTHKVIFTHDTNQQLAFFVNIEDVENIKQKKGWFSGITHINLYTNKKGKIRITSQNSNQLIQINSHLQTAQQKKAWLQKQQQKQGQAQQKQGLYTGYNQLIQKQKEEIKSQESKFQSNFQQGKGIEELIKHANELKEITEYIKTHTSVYKEQNNTEVDHILEGIGLFNIITKDQAGKDFINQLSRQIYNEVVENLFRIYGDIVPMMEVFYFYNKRRGGLNLISVREFYQACKNFENLPEIQAKIAVYENNKVIESTKLSSENDFESDIGKFIDHNGITPEQLSKKLTIEINKNNKGKAIGSVSVLVARIKLNKAMQKGQIIIDDRIEGQKYFKNYIMHGFPSNF